MDLNKDIEAVLVLMLYCLKVMVLGQNAEMGSDMNRYIKEKLCPNLKGTVFLQHWVSRSKAGKEYCLLNLILY
jgi:hypothetical protein